jgi:hypothetical protein
MSQAQIEAGKANIAPYHWKAGQSGNPTGKPKGTPSIPAIIARLLAMPAQEWHEFQPGNAAEVIALQSIKDAARSTFIDPAAVKSREFIVDRLHGKPVQRRADVTESETVAAARRDYEVSRRYVLALNEMLGEICCETCAAKIGQVFAESDLIQSILATTDEKYREVVERELESVAGE